MTRGAALAAALLASGCATMFDHPSKNFSLQTIPDGAQYQLYEASNPNLPLKVGVTPASLRLPRGDGYFQAKKYTVVVQKEGYDTETVPFEMSITANYWWNLAMTPVIPTWPFISMLIVDPLTGAMYDPELPTAVVLRKQVALPPNE